MLDIAHRRRKTKPRPLVLICDVSGSMERYTRMLLHFVHTVAVSGQQLEAFLFGHSPDPHHPPPGAPWRRSRRI